VRKLLILAAMGCAGLMTGAGHAASQSCEPTATHHALRIGGDAGTGPLVLHTGEAFRREIGNGWIFALEPHKFGWSIRLYDGAIDLSAATPPHGGVPNPRDLFGWHFRNADNTGPNRGDVNAPQGDRRFVFATSRAMLAKLAPATDPGVPRYVEPGPDAGVGRLEVLGYKLADLERGSKARMIYLEFEVCLSWPKASADPDGDPVDAGPTYSAEDIETFGSCGLDLETFELDAAILPRGLQVDLDGDDALDTIAQIRRRSDGKRGLALCRAGTWLHVLGMDGRPVGEALRPGYFDQLEAWGSLARDHGPLGYEGEPAWPLSDGDVLVLERIEKEMILLYWKDGGLHSRQVYRFVEP
jgi:hypothetical protein